MSEGRQDHELIVASRVKGTDVYNAAHERIGHIEDVSIDKVSGHVRYALMSAGGFLGIGDKLHPLPWQILTYQPSEGGYVVRLEKDALKGAPSYSPEELQNFGGRDVSYREAIFKYHAPYGIMPYW